MTAKTIETKAIISAEDKSGQAFASFLRNLHGAEQAAKEARIAVRDQDRAAMREAAMVRRQQVAHVREERQIRQEMQHHGIRKYVAQTAAAAVAAHSVVDVVRDSIKAGANYQHEVVALQNAGRNAEEMKEITAAARDAVKNIPTSTYTENLKVINETIGAFGNLNHAIENLPFMQMATSVLHSAAGDKIHEDAGELGNKMARFFEMRGTAGNTEVFQKEASEMMRAMVFTRGNFNPSEMLNFAQQAKGSLQNYSIGYLSRIVPSLVTENGGDRAGTAANAFTNTVMGKANDAKQAEEWAKYGLLDTKQAIMKKGKITSWRAGAVKETDLALSNPLDWFEKVALPAMAAKGVDINDKLAVAKVFGTMFRNQNANLWANENAQALSRQRLHKDDVNIGGVDDPKNIYKRNLTDDPLTSMTAFTASLENFTTVLSKAAMPSIASGLTALASGIEAVSNVLHDHPIAAITGGSLAAGGALAGSGYMAYQLANGFGLSGAAGTLEVASGHLEIAAARLTASGALGQAEHALGGAAAGAGGTVAKTAGAVLATEVAPLAVAAGALLFGAKLYKDANPEEFRRNGRSSSAPPPSSYMPTFGLGRYGMETPIKHYMPAGRGRAAGWMDDPHSPMLAPIGPTTPTPTLAPKGAASPFGSLGGAHAALEQKVSVQVQPPPPLQVKIDVVPGSEMIAIRNAVQLLSAKLTVLAHADTHPGGLGETHTGQ